MTNNSFIRRARLGATLVEVIITTGVFSLLMITLFVMVQYGVRSWTKVEGETVVQTMLRKVEAFALEDIRNTSFSQMAIATGSGYSQDDDKFEGKSTRTTAGNIVTPANLKHGVSKSGSGVCFMSAYSYTLDSGKFVRGNVFNRDETGKPAWKYNILYYCTALSKGLHKDIYGFNCDDKYCPHKWLIRKEINSSVLLDGTNGAASAVDYMTQPTQYDIYNQMKDEKNLIKVQVIADSILAFVVTANPPEVILTIKAFRVTEGNKAGISVGNSTLDDSPYTVQYNVVVFPNN